MKILKLLLLSVLGLLFSVFVFLELFYFTQTQRVAEANNISTAGVPLAIIDVPHDPYNAPSVGWCGETTVQMAFFNYGVFVPQQIINRLSNTPHPDMHFNDIPVVLDYFGVETQSWYDHPSPFGVAMMYFRSFYHSKEANLHSFIHWVKQELSQGFPVILGVRSSPFEIDYWPLDHFVLGVGYSEEGIIANPNNPARARNISRARTVIEYDFPTDNPYTFHNRFHYYYGYSIRSVLGQDNSISPVINLESESEETSILRITPPNIGDIDVIYKKTYQLDENDRMELINSSILEFSDDFIIDSVDKNTIVVYSLV